MMPSKYIGIVSILFLQILSGFKSAAAVNDSSWQIGPFIKMDNVNPILLPRNDTLFHCPVLKEFIQWELKDVFNPTALVKDGVVHMLYRAEDVIGSALGTSRIGLATSTDGLYFSREATPIFYPDNDSALEYEWDGGCEDPRIVADANGTYYMTYTAYNGTIARLFIATTRDFRTWVKHGSIFKNYGDGEYVEMWSKSGSIVCDLIEEQFIAKEINGKYWMYYGESDIFLASSTDLINWSPVFNESTGDLLTIFGPVEGRFDSDIVEPGPQSVVTKDGILMIYNSRNKDPEAGGDPNLPKGTYSAGQILFDLNDPSVVLQRSENYFMKPEKDYEIVGQVGNVVFLEGLVSYKGLWFLYYGTADSKIAVAIANM